MGKVNVAPSSAPSPSTPSPSQSVPASTTSSLSISITPTSSLSQGASPSSSSTTDAAPVSATRSPVSGSTNANDSSGDDMSIGLVAGVVAACTMGVGVAAVAVYRRKDDRTRRVPWGIHWGTKDDRTKTAVGADAFGPAVSKPPL